MLKHKVRGVCGGAVISWMGAQKSTRAQKAVPMAILVPSVTPLSAPAPPEEAAEGVDYLSAVLVSTSLNNAAKAAFALPT